MQYKIIPFVAQLTQKGTSAEVASQLQTLVTQHANEGWEYVRLENVETTVLPDNGCFGLGAKQGYTTVYSMAVFKK